MTSLAIAYQPRLLTQQFSQFSDRLLTLLRHDRSVTRHISSRALAVIIGAVTPVVVCLVFADPAPVAAATQACFATFPG